MMAEPRELATSGSASLPAKSPSLSALYELTLMPGEEIVYAGEPDRRRLLHYIMAGGAFSSLFALGLLLPLVLLLYPFFSAWVKRHQYWMTNRRVVVSNGLIGYRTRSVPFERISDVAISSNWLERIFGLRTITVRDMTGEAQSGASLMAAPDAERLQEAILTRVAEANRIHTNEAPVSEHGRPYRTIEAKATSEEMLTLLRRIERNTRPDEIGDYGT